MWKKKKNKHRKLVGIFCSRPSFYFALVPSTHNAQNAGNQDEFDQIFCEKESIKKRDNDGGGGHIIFSPYTKKKPTTNKIFFFSFWVEYTYIYIFFSFSFNCA